jgi:succinylglutamate desuccinylase
MLDVIHHIPDGLLELSASELHTILEGPTLIHLPGRRPEPLLVSALLHGNEVTGLLALQELLIKYRERELPRALSIFIGNVAAAREGKRRLDGQPDYNRIWRDDGAPEHAMARQVVEEMRARKVFASVDVHNNTGMNPHYAIVSHLDHRFFQLATLFGRTVVYSAKPDTTNTFAFSDLCPALTLECGMPGEPRGTKHVLEYLDGCLHLDHIPDVPVHAHDMDLFHTVAIVKIPSSYTFGFGTHDTDLQFMAEMDHLNFQVLDAGATFARRRPGSDAYLEAWNDHGEQAGDRYFAIEGDEIRIQLPVMPSMLTLQQDIIRMDCLCYLMERVDWQRHLGVETSSHAG